MSASTAPSCWRCFSGSISLLRGSASSLSRRAQKLGKARRGRLLVGVRSPPWHHRCVQRDATPVDAGAAAWMESGCAGGQVSRLCGHRRAIPRQIKLLRLDFDPSGCYVQLLRKASLGPGSNLQRLGYAIS
uniref:Uncharacterized protein n=1 Tax=Zea mays TaxID=4577 RepID=A0A804QY71_MAIZE